MKNLEVFKNSEFGAVRVIVRDNEPWFVGNEVAKILGYGNTRDALAKHVDDEDKGVAICDTLGGKQKLTIINESGLYSLILKSKLPQAKKFKRWVTSEVLPAIRKHGGYLTPEKVEEALLNPDTIIQLATKLKEEQQKRKEAENRLNKVKPKVEYAEAIIKSETSIELGQYAKIIAKRLNNKIGRNTLFKILRDNKILMSDKNNKNIPYQVYINKGYFEVVETTYYKGDELATGLKTLVTGRGQEKLYHILNKIIKDTKKWH